MSEIKAMRLAQAATTYNVSMDHLVEELKKNGETVVNNPSTKISAELVQLLDKAFNKDKAIKAQADNTKMIEKPKKETLELSQEIPVSAKKAEDEKELQIKSNLAVKDTEKAAKAEEPAPQPEKMETEVHKLDGPKIVGKVDLTKPKKTTAKKKVEEEKVVEEAPIAPVVEPEAEEIAKEDVVDLNHIQRTKVQLEGPKIMGKIELKPDRSELPPKRDANKPAPPGSNNNNEKRVRKRIEKPKRTPLQNSPGGPGGGHHRGPGDNRHGGPDNRPPHRDENGVVQISEKEIEDKIRATMSKIQNMTSKSDRSKFRREKREAIQEKLAAEQADQRNSKLKVTEFMTAAELASLMNVPAVKIIQTCMQLGIMVSINQRLDAEIIELVAGENGFEVEFQSIEDQIGYC